MAEKLVPLVKDGVPQSIAVDPGDFFRTRLVRRTNAPAGSTDRDAMETYAEAGYSLGERYESGEVYDGPKTQRQYERRQAERQAARATDAPKTESTPAPARAEAKKGD